jgi:hypothetical protein
MQIDLCSGRCRWLCTVRCLRACASVRTCPPYSGASPSGVRPPCAGGAEKLQPTTLPAGVAEVAEEGGAADHPPQHQRPSHAAATSRTSPGRHWSRPPWQRSAAGRTQACRPSCPQQRPSSGGRPALDGQPGSPCPTGSDLGQSSRPRLHPSPGAAPPHPGGRTKPQHAAGCTLSEHCSLPRLRFAAAAPRPSPGRHWRQLRGEPSLLCGSNVNVHAHTDPDTNATTTTN